MSNALEQRWVAWLNSDRWRRLTARDAVAGKILRSGAFGRFNMARRFALTYYRSRRQPRLFADVRIFCTFVGHVKSGSTLIGSLLDAHPDVIMADEIDVLSCLAAGFSKEQIFHLLLKGSRREQMKGRVTARRLTPYSVAVPGQWQGRYRRMRVIGHSQAGPMTGRLLREPHLLQDLQKVMSDVQLRMIHVIRNPFDPISLMMVRGNRSFANAIDHYFSYCDVLSQLREQLDETMLCSMKYEDLICEPRLHMHKLCRFLDLEAADDYLEACVDVLHDSPEKSRDIIDWQAPWIQVVEKEIDRVSFLKGYSYHDSGRVETTDRSKSEQAAIHDHE